MRVDIHAIIRLTTSFGEVPGLAAGVKQSNDKYHMVLIGAV